MFRKILLLLLIPLLASGQSKKFRCNSPEDVREMDIKQVFRVDNQTFLLRRNQLIYFRAPFCFFNSKKQTVCTASQPFESKTEFKGRPGNKLKGFYYKSAKSYSIYENLGDKKLEAYQILSVDPNDLAMGGNDIIKLLRRSSVFEDASFTLLYEYGDRSYFVISYEVNNPNRLILKLLDKDEEYSSTKKLDFKLSNLMAYIRYPSGNESFLVFDLESSKLHISFFETNQSPNGIQMHTRPIDFAELFNCVRKLEKEEDLKGIFYSAGTSTSDTSPRWYIFIQRFFLEIKEDLLATRFSISDEHYRAVKEIDFPEDVLFNLDLKKFVKEVESNAYFVTLGRIFKLDLSGGSPVEMPPNQPDHLMECEHSTLDQEGALFCFAPDQLFIISSDAKPIGYANLFRGTGVRFDADDRVQVAFSHLESIILMTRTSYYTFSKDSLQLKGSQITLRPSSNKPVTKSTHYLFQKSSQIRTGSAILFWLVMILVIGIILLIIYLRADDILSVFQRRPRTLTKLSPIKFEKRKNLSEKDEERSRSYRKLFGKFFTSIGHSFSSSSPKDEKSERSGKSGRSERSEKSQTLQEAGMISGISKIQPSTNVSSSTSSSTGNIMLHGSTKSFGFGLGKPIVIIPKHRLEAKKLKASKAALRRTRS